LYVSKTSIGKHGAVVLAEALKVNTALKALDINNCCENVS